MKKISLLLFISVLIITSLKAQTGQGLSFDGIDDRVTIGNNAAYNVGTGNFTIEAWVKLSTSQNVTFPSVISKRDAGNTFSGMLLMIYQGRIMMQIAGINLGQGAANIQDNICHHIAVTRTGTVVNYYVDGNIDATISSSGSINTVHGLWIGRDEPASSTTPFKGLIHEIRYWNIARTQTQIQGSKNTFLTGSESGLIGYWRMNDGSGQTVNDFTSINNDGFLGAINTADNADPVYLGGCICGASITAGGPITFCTGGSVVLTANSGTGYTYQWKLNGNNIAGATLINYTASAGGNYTCIVTNTCGANTSNIITVTIIASSPFANITAGGPTTFCSNSNVLLSSTNTGVGISYQWQKNSVNIAGAVSVNYTANQTGSYRCVVTNPCGSSNSNAISVTVNTQPAAIITPSGTVNICTGASKLLTASAGTGYIYQWKKNGADISGATSQTYTTSLAGSYTVVITSGTCTATSAATTVTVNQALTPTISNNGFGGFCGSTAVILDTQIGSGFIYQWFEDSHPIPGSNSSELNVGHNGTFSVQINNGCGTYLSSSSNVNDFTNPWLTPYITIGNSGSLNLCAGGSVNLFISSNTFFFSPTFEWYKDGVPVGSGTSYNATTGGNYACSVYDFYWGCGSQGPTVFSNWLVVTSAPSATITPQGSTTICSGQSVVLSANAGGGFAYQWKNNGTNISGVTNQNYTANTAGSYSVVVTNTCGTATSTAVAVTVNALPSATITPAGPTTFCMGDMLVLNAPTGANKTYQWLKGGNNISGATAESYSATTGGNYKVTVTNTMTGCSKTTANATVLTSNPQPSATITPQGPTTFCAGSSVVLKGNSGTGLTYQWKKGGNNISGATNKNYTATLAGTYKLKVTNSNGCSKLSDGVTVTIPCKLNESENDGEFDVNVYPNPSSGDFTVEVENKINSAISIRIYDLTGRLILTDTIVNSKLVIQNPQLSQGAYSMIISDGNFYKIIKLIKTM